MNKIYNSAKDPILRKIIIRVNPQYGDSFADFLKSKGYQYLSDGTPHTIQVPGLGTVQCYAFLLDYSDKLRDDVGEWNIEV
jgi:hypothetical protein